LGERLIRISLFISLFVCFVADAYAVQDTTSPNQLDFIIPQYSEPGNWSLSQIVLHDAVDNKQTYSTDDIKALGINTILTVISNEDAIPPKLLDVSLSPRTIDVTSEDGAVSVTLHAKDNLSGVRFVWVQFNAPSGKNRYMHSSSPKSVSNDVKTYQLDFVIPQYSESGNWSLTRIVLFDVVDNKQIYSTDDIRALGINTTLAVISNEDSIPPKLLDVSLSPRTIDVTSKDGAVSVTVHAKDNLSGIRYVFVQLNAPSGKYRYRQSFSSKSVSNGVETHQLDFVVPQYSESGNCSLSQIVLNDAVDNKQTYSTDDIRALGINTILTVIPGADDTASLQADISTEGKTTKSKRTDQSVDFEESPKKELDEKLRISKFIQRELFVDGDGTWEKANTLTLGEFISDNIDAPAGDKEDWYRFSVQENEGKIKIHLTNESAQHALSLILYDSSPKRLQSHIVKQESKNVSQVFHEFDTFRVRIVAAKPGAIADYQLMVECVPPPDLPPTVRILRPHPGKLVQTSSVEVELQSSDDRGIDTVTVNGFSAVREPDGHYIAMVENLKDGLNALSATAKDTKGQEASDRVEIRVDLPYRFGLVIGVKEYRYFPERNLKYSASDAQKMAVSLRKFSFDIPDRRILIGAKATRPEVKGKIAELQSLVTSNDIVFIYFSGHGVKGSFDCLVTNDAREDNEGNLLPNTVIATAELREDLKLINAAKIIVALDSCHSGGTMKWRPLQSIGEVNLPPRTVMLASSDGNEPSWESDRFQSGIFTHYLVRLLDDESIADRNRDGTATLKEIEAYLQEQVSAQSYRERKVMQTPIVKTQKTVWRLRGLFEINHADTE